MSKKIAIAAAAMIAMGMMAGSVSSASASSYGHYSGCFTKKIKVPAWKTVWRTKKVAVPYGCGWEIIKYRKTIKVWHTKWKKVCH